MPTKLSSKALASDAVTVANIPDGEITSDKLHTTALSNFSTTNLAEGTNQYFTETRARSALSGTSPTFTDVTLTGELRGPASLVIDPAGIGDNTGVVVIKGDLQVDGTTTTINSTVVSLDDKNIVLADGAANASAADGAGITIAGANASLTYSSAADIFLTNKTLRIADGANTLQLGQWDASTNRIESVGRGLFLTTYDGLLQLGIDGTADVTISTDRKVGIGIATPARTLHVKTPAGDQGIAAFEANNSGLVIQDNSSSNGNVEIVGYRQTASTYHNILLRGSTGGLLVKSDGTGIVVGPTSTRPTTINTGAIYLQGETGGWSVPYGFKNASGTYVGGFGMFGNGNSVDNFWVGPDYNNNYMTWDSSAVKSNRPHVSQNGYHWLQKELPQFSFGAGGVTDEYLVLAKIFDNAGNIASSGVIGEIIAARGSTSTGNSSCKTRIHVTCAYNNNYCGEFTTTGSRDFYKISIITIDGVKYYAAKAREGGGEAHLGISFSGWIITDNASNLLTRVRTSDAGVAWVSDVFYPTQARTTSDNTLRLETNGSDRLVIASSGKVGINNADPSTYLDINGGTKGALTVRSTYNYSDDNYAIRIIGDSSTPYGYLSQYVNLGGFLLAQGGRYYGGGPFIADSSTTTFSSIRGVNGDIVINTNAGLTAGGQFTPTERLRVNSSGYVGIGNPDPKSVLHVSNGFGAGSSGILNLTPNGSGGSAGLIVAGNNDSGGTAGPNVIAFANRTIAFGAGDSFTSSSGGTATYWANISSTGLAIGSGFNTATAKLAVYGAADDNQSSDATFLVSCYSSNDWGQIIDKGVNSDYGLQINVASSAAYGLRVNTGFRVNGSGEVFNATSYTSGNVIVRGYDTAPRGLYIQEWDGATQYGGGISYDSVADQLYVFTRNGSDTDNKAIIINRGSNSITVPGQIIVPVGNGGSGSDAIRIQGTGNYESLGIGTVGAYGGMIRSYGNDLHYYAGHWRTTATASEDHSHYWYTSRNGSTDWSSWKMRLDHNGSLSIANHLRLDNSSADGAQLVLASSGYSDWNIDNYSSTLRFYYGSTVNMSLSSGGNLLVTGTITESSTRRIKENIRPITNALEVVNKLQGVIYDKIDGSQKDEPGLIAEDALEAIANLVVFDDDGQPAGVKYTKTVAYLIEAVKELTAKVNALENK